MIDWNKCSTRYSKTNICAVLYVNIGSIAVLLRMCDNNDNSTYFVSYIRNICNSAFQYIRLLPDVSVTPNIQSTLSTQHCEYSAMPIKTLRFNYSMLHGNLHIQVPQKKACNIMYYAEVDNAALKTLYFRVYLYLN